MRIPDVVIDALLADRSLSFTQRSLYLFSLACTAQSGSELADKVGLSPSSVFRHCRRLREREWMELLGSVRRFCPVALIPRACQKKMVDALEEAYRLAPGKGEFLLKRNLDLWVRSEEFVDNARPAFLVNPRTKKPLEYDRWYYRIGVAVEFNGPQHATTTAAHPSEEELIEVKTRDLIKKALSTEANVMLITVRAEDLEHTAFEKLLPDSLPRNRVDKNGPYCRALALLCANYAAAATRFGPDTKTAKPDVRR
jgi:hypothetical protein